MKIRTEQFTQIVRTEDQGQMIFMGDAACMRICMIPSYGDRMTVEMDRDEGLALVERLASMLADHNSRSTVVASEGDQELLLRWDNRGEPYRRGITFTLGGWEDQASLFVEEVEARYLLQDLRKVPGLEPGGDAPAPGM